MKNTSKQAYKDIHESGYLTKKQKEVYNWIIATGPMTANEINKHTKSTSNHKRLSELKDKGLVMECGSRRDEATHKMVTVWGKTPSGYTPQVTDKKPTKESLEALIAHYRDGHVASAIYNEGYIAGWTACINSLQGAVPVNLIIPEKVWE